MGHHFHSRHSSDAPHSAHPHHAGGSTELSRINDPNFIVELAVGPPFPELVPQRPGSGLTLGRQFRDRDTRFIFKKAHLSADDNRIFDEETGLVVLNSHHYGKNPLGGLDPLGLTPESTWWGDTHLGEWKSILHVTGYRGMPDFKVHPKVMSRHHRQYIMDSYDEASIYFNIAKQSRFKHMSIRHNLVVCQGDTDEDVYTILADLHGRTMQIVNEKEELVTFIQMPLKAMILNAAFGAGSELIIDVAPGVDWTAVLAIVIGLKHMGNTYMKDAVSNFVVNPAQNVATNAAVAEVGVLYQQGAAVDEQQFESAVSQTVAFVQQGPSVDISQLEQAADIDYNEIASNVGDFFTGIMDMFNN